MDAIVETSRGRLRGRAEQGVLAFRGVPYARPPVDRLRWRSPQPPEPWGGVREALRFGASAPQVPGMLGRLVAGVGDAEPSEDCLTLNVFTPALDGGRRPVLVWIHGGGFTSGSGGSAIYDGSELARRGDVVVVTLNYRLGALGFLCLAAFEEDGARGNFGLRDQLAALRFVRDEIGCFGGDPGGVTVFGESAGAMSVGVLLGLPEARGLFRRAILQSGAASNVSSREQAERVAWTFLRELGLEHADVARLRALPVQALLDAQTRTLAALWRDIDGLAFQPALDETLLARSPLEAIAAGACAELPLLIGTNLDEYKLYRPTDPRVEGLDEPGLLRRLTRRVPGGEDAVRPLVETYRRARRGRAPTDATELWFAIETDRLFRIPALRLVDAARRHRPGGGFVYLFTWPSPALDGRLGSCHALEVPFVFGSHRLPALKAFVGEGAELERLSHRMQDAWIAFARCASPGSAARWPAYDDARPTRIFGPGGGVELDPGAEERLAWEGLL